MKRIIRIEKTWLFAVFILLILAVFSGAPAWAQCTLPATGQTECYDGQGIVPCPAVGFPGQDAETAYNPLSYTLVSNVPGQETVIDNNTGLEWTQAAFQAMPWQQALQFCDSLHWGGHGDWRLPNVKELQSIVDYGRSGPAIDPIFEDAMGGAGYWSSTTSSFLVGPNLTEGYGDAIGTVIGGLYQRIKLEPNSVRPVRGCPGGLGCTLPATGQHSCFTLTSKGSCPAAGFPNEDAENIYNPMSYTLDATVSGQETIHDNVTGLEWSQHVWTRQQLNLTWQIALQLADTLHWGGHDDWRMPNLKELQSLALYEGNYNEIDPIFQDALYNYWSSTTVANASNMVWRYYFGEWAQYGRRYKTNKHDLRVVRYCTAPPTQT